jgi:hypothetical protein
MVLAVVFLFVTFVVVLICGCVMARRAPTLKL